MSSRGRHLPLCKWGMPRLGSSNARRKSTVFLPGWATKMDQTAIKSAISAHQAQSRPAPVSRETVVTAIINQKGGVGKTTTAVSVAHGLTLQGRKVLLVDLDAQANATLSLGGDTEAQESAAHLLLEPDSPPPVPAQSKYDNLHILNGSQELVRAELALLMSAPEGRESILRRAFNRAGYAYDHIIIDSPPSLGLLALNILAASDNILVPVQAEFLALEGVNNLRRTVELLASQSGRDLDILGFVITMVDGRTNLSQSVAAGLRATLGDMVFNASIPRTVRLSECPSLRCSIFEYDRWGTGARAYEALVFELLGRLHASRKRSRQ